MKFTSCTYTHWQYQYNVWYLLILFASKPGPQKGKEHARMKTSAPQLLRSTPEAEGISSAAILAFVDALEAHAHPLDAIQGFMLLRHGRVAAEGWWAPYGLDTPHTMYSLSKSFTATGIGLAVAEGLLTVDDPVLRFFPEEAPADPGAHLQAMCVHHLLAMNTGHHEDTTAHVFRGADDNWPRAFLSLPVEHAPGSWFVYNTAATYMLSAILTRLTGTSLLEYLRPRLFTPLGIANPTWETDPRGISLGGTGLHITTEAIARFGQLYLQQGSWEGRQLVPAAWVAEATHAHSDNSNTQTNPDWRAGYGYQFWRCRPNCYRGDGAFGQYCIVMPEQDAVLAMVGGVRDMQAVLDKVWAHLLPAMGPAALPMAPAADDALAARLATLALPLPQGQLTSPSAARWHGKSYELEPNDQKLGHVTLHFEDTRTVLTMGDERGEHRLLVGHGTWLKGMSTLRGPSTEPVAACGAWTAEATYEVRCAYFTGEVGQVYRFHFTGRSLRLEVEPNVSWESTAMVTLQGR